MPDPRSTYSNLFGHIIGSVYQLEAKLGFGSRPIYKSKPKISSKLVFLGLKQVALERSPSYLCAKNGLDFLVSPMVANAIP